MNSFFGGKHSGSKSRHKRWANKRMNRPEKQARMDRGYIKIFALLGLEHLRA